MVDLDQDLILASGSPRRRQLLEQAGYSFRVIEPDVTEAPPGPDAEPRLYAELLAVHKAKAVADGLTEGVVVSADTVVELDGQIIGKPSDPADAKRILARLSRSEHHVITGLCVWHVAPRVYVVGSDRTAIRMRAMSDADIEAYVASGEAMGKAGAYAIQETGDRFVERVAGSFSNVVGLPMELLEQMLGVTVPPASSPSNHG